MTVTCQWPWNSEGGRLMHGCDIMQCLILCVTQTSREEIWPSGPKWKKCITSFRFFLNIYMTHYRNSKDSPKIGVTHSYVRQGLIDICVILQTHDTKTRRHARTRTHTHMTHSCLWQNPLKCVTQFTWVCNVTHFDVWHDSFVCVNVNLNCDTTRSFHTCDIWQISTPLTSHVLLNRVTYTIVLHIRMSLVCVTWRIHMCGIWL